MNMQAYGSTAARVDRFHVEGNIFCKGSQSERGGILVGGQYPSQGVRVVENFGYGGALYIGYEDGGDDLIATGNRIWGDFAWKPAFTNVRAHDNFVWQNGWKTPRRDGGNIPAPTEPYVLLKINACDSNRAHLAVLNFPGLSEVQVDPGRFLKSGEAYKVYDPTQLFGKPVLSATYRGGRVSFPLRDKFAVYVICKEHVGSETGPFKD